MPRLSRRSIRAWRTFGPARSAMIPRGNSAIAIWTDMSLVEKSSQGGSRCDVLKLRRGGLRLRLIGRMAEIATTIAFAVEEQCAATQEISRNVQEAAHGTGQ